MKETINLSFESSSSSENKNNPINSKEDLEKILFNNPIPDESNTYPAEEIYFMPITIKSNKESCFLYFPKIIFYHFVNESPGYLTHQFEDNDSMTQKLKSDIFLYFKKLYSTINLEKRLKISYEKLKDINPNYSFALEMSEQLKKKSFVKSQIKDYVFIKKNILKNLDFDKQNIITDDPFNLLRLNSIENTNKKLFPKYAKSILDKKDSDYEDDDEDLIEYRESLIEQKDEDPAKSYKDILKQLFKVTELRKDIINYCLDNDKDFDNNDFEKFICYLEYFITLFTGIQVKYSIDELGLLNMDFYASEKTFMKMAEILHYVAQFKIRDKSYYENRKRKNNISLFSLIKLNTKQYEEYDFDKIEYFPIYTIFMVPLACNFRRYDKNDLYHLCKKCANIKSDQIMNIDCNSSLFRFIDKTRLLYMSLLPIINLGYIEKMIKSESNQINQIFKSSIFLRNESVLNNLKDEYIIKTYLYPIKTLHSKKIDNIFKNTFGETVGYYYVWVAHYITWLIFPTILGLIFEVISFLVTDQVYTYFNIIFLSIIILWGFYYTEDWSCLQIFYNHIWGINGYIGEKSNLYDENYYKVSYITFLGTKMEKIDNFQKIKKIIISIFTLSFLSLLIIFINIIVFYVYKLKHLNQYFLINYRYQVPILILIIREVISIYIYKVTKKLAHLENPTDKDKYLELVTRKRLILEYINYYFNLYYIAFYHKLAGKCYFGNCLQELNNQLIMILITDSLFVIIKLFYKTYNLTKAKRSFESSLMKHYDKSDNINERESTSIKFKIYTREEFSEESIQKIILPVIFHFGYVIQFGACFPISFLFLLILAIFCRVTDALSMINIFYLKTIEASKGLKAYNRMQTRIIFIGIFTNIGIIFFTKGKSFLEKEAINAFILIICVENGLFFIFKTFNIEHFPFWFRYKDNIKLRYLKKFGVVQSFKGDKYAEKNKTNMNLTIGKKKI